MCRERREIEARAIGRTASPGGLLWEKKETPKSWLQAPEGQRLHRGDGTCRREAWVPNEGRAVKVPQGEEGEIILENVTFRNLWSPRAQMFNRYVSLELGGQMHLFTHPFIP